MCGSTSMSAYRPFGIPTCRVCGIQDTRHAGRPVGVPAYRHDSTPTPDRRPCTSAFRKRSEPDGRQVGVSVGRDSDQAACPSLAGWAARPASCSAYRVPGLPECRPHAPACPLSGGRVQRAVGPPDAPPLRRRLSWESSTNAGWERVAGLQAFGRHSVMPLCWHVVVSACRPRGRELTPGLAAGARGFVPPSCVPPCRRAAELGDTSRLPTSMALARFV